MAAKAMNVTTKELNKMLELGQVMAKDLLPKMIPQFQELSKNALPEMLKSSRVAMQRMILTSQKAADTIFTQGKGGLTAVFNDLAIVIKDLVPLWTSLGKIIGIALHAVSIAIKILTPFLVALSDVFGLLTDNVWSAGAAITAVVLTMRGPAMAAATRAAWLFIAPWLKILAPILAIAAALSEIRNFYVGDKNGLRATLAQRTKGTVVGGDVEQIQNDIRSGKKNMIVGALEQEIITSPALSFIRDFSTMMNPFGEGSYLRGKMPDFSGFNKASTYRGEYLANYVASVQVNIDGKAVADEDIAHNVMQSNFQNAVKQAD